MAHHRGRDVGGEVVVHALMRVIGMAMGHEGAVDGLPRVDVEIARFAIDAPIGECQKIAHDPEGSAGDRAG